MLAQLLENLSLCYLGIQAQQLVNVVFDAFKPFFRCGEIQQLIHRQHPGSMDDRLVDMVHNQVAVRGVFLAEEHQVYSEFALQFFLQILPVCTHVPVFFEDATQLLAACPFPVTVLVERFNFRQRNPFLYLSSPFDKHRAVLLVGFISHGGQHRFELGEGRKSILFGCVDVRCRFLFPVHAQQLVYHFLRTPALMGMGYLAPVGCDSGSHHVQVGVVGIVVRIDEPGLSGFGISHLLEILVRKVQQLGFCHFMSLATDGYMELRLLDAVVGRTVFLQEVNLVVRGGWAHDTECTEILHLDEPGKSFRNLMFIVTDGMEVGASG